MVEVADRGRNPFDNTGVELGADGIKRYVNRPASLVEMLRASVERGPDAPAIIDIIGEVDLSYQELWDRAARVAGGLRAQGIERGDRVAINIPNGFGWAVAFWGIELAGAVVVPVNTRFKESEVAYVVDDSGAKLTLEAGAELPDGEPLDCDDLQPDDLAAIFYTSGTTGFPKGAMTSHANFLTNSENVIRTLRLDRAEGPELSTLISVPMFHVTGCNSQLIPLLELGGRCAILQSALDLNGIIDAMNTYGITHMVSVPAIYYALLNHPRLGEIDSSKLRGISYGGAPMPAPIVHQLGDHFSSARLGNGFGLTESCSLLSSLPDEDAAEHADSVGFAMPVCDFAIDQPDEKTGVGELLARGPNIVMGYWNKPEATAETFVDGWLHTGDLARIDDEGLLYIVDRKKDMINRGGENVYSAEVESALAGAPGVGEASVIGVPDPMMGEKVGAVIVPAAGVEFDAAAVVAHVREQIADFKVPQYIALRDEPLPRNPGGKVLKGQLREETEWGAPLR
jgi:long-chain acyl-CoA synthetase